MTSPLLVFVQDATLQGALTDASALTAYGERFFMTRLGLAEPMIDGPIRRTRWVVAPARATAGIRTVWIRPRADADLEEARAVEARGNAAGMALLAARCMSVWVVERDGDGDALALRLAAIVAGVGLGPILDRDAPALFGVRTARVQLETLESGAEPAARKPG